MPQTSRARSTLFALALTAVAAVLTGCSSSTPGTSTTVTRTAPAPSTTPGSSSGTSSAPVAAKPKPTKPVHIQAYPGDGSTVGVGMPIFATFKKKITDARAFAKAVTVTVNGKPANGAWYFEYTDPSSGHVMEGHYRQKNYWPAHAHIHVGFNTKGVSAGSGLAFDDSLTLDYQTGAAHIATVNDASHTMTVMSDGKLYGTFPVSLGAPDTQTKRGTKVIMDKGRVVRMTGPGYDDCCVKYTQRLTYGGEYLHAAPWNCEGSPGCTGPSNNIGRADSSNGCTNLKPDDAIRLYNFLRIGDVVQYPNVAGPPMTLGQGYGDWNVLWSEWQTGGAVRTS